MNTLEILAAFRPFGPQVLASGTRSASNSYKRAKFVQKDIFVQGHFQNIRTKGHICTKRDIYCVEQKFSPSCPIRLGRDPKTFRNLNTNKVKVLAKFGQDWSRGFREKLLQGTSGFVDL